MTLTRRESVVDKMAEAELHHSLGSFVVMGARQPKTTVAAIHGLHVIYAQPGAMHSASAGTVRSSVILTSPAVHAERSFRPTGRL